MPETSSWQSADVFRPQDHLPGSKSAQVLLHEVPGQVGGQFPLERELRERGLNADGRHVFLAIC